MKILIPIYSKFECIQRQILFKKFLHSYSLVFFFNFLSNFQLWCSPFLNMIDNNITLIFEILQGGTYVTSSPQFWGHLCLKIPPSFTLTIVQLSILGVISYNHILKLLELDCLRLSSWYLLIQLLTASAPSTKPYLWTHFWVFFVSKKRKQGHLTSDSELWEILFLARPKILQNPTFLGTTLGELLT